MVYRPYFLTALIFQKAIWIPTRFILKFFGRLEIKGLNNLDSVKGNVIFACNHSSEMDPLFVPASLPFWSRFSPIFYASREKGNYKSSGWRQIFYGGMFFKLLGSFPVFHGLKDYEKSLVNHTDILNKGGNLCFFPEGGITKTGNIQPARGGVGYLAHLTQKAIVPVYINGTYSISFMDFLLRKRKLSIMYGKPVYFTDFRVGNNNSDIYRNFAQNIIDTVSVLKNS
jgi:1-acyl-sn-glycerol-3-phosphate acyltransferase